MPEIITCPDCGRKLRVSDQLVGKKVKCPDCNVKFTGGITTAPAAKVGKSAVPKRATDEDEDDDRPRRRGRSQRDDDDDEENDDRPRRDRFKSTPEQKRAGWKMTLLGLNLLCYATYVLMGIVVVEALGCSVIALIGVVGMSSMNNDPNVGLGSLMGAGIAAFLLYGFLFLGYTLFLVVQVTGHGFCIAVPQKVGTIRKPMAIATFCCISAMVLLGFLGCGVSYGLRSQGGMVIGFVPLAISIGYHVCYFLFLKAVADALRDPVLGKQLLTFTIVLPTVWVLSMCMYFVMVFALAGSMIGTMSSGNADYLAGGGLFGMGCSILFFCVYVGLFVWYTMLIHQVRNAVRGYLE